jgi:hypothetical protein
MFCRANADRAALCKYAAMKNVMLIACPVDRLHTCANGCRMWRVSGEHTYVCCESHLIHHCGALCDHIKVSEEEEVCTLTGEILNGPEEFDHRPYDEHGRVERRNGPTHTPSRAHTDTEALCRKFTNAILKLFISDQPIQRYKQQIRGIYQRIKTKKIAPTYININGAIWNVLHEHGYALATQIKTNDNRIEKLAQNIMIYWLKYDIKCSNRNITAFVAAVLEKLRVGWIILGVTFFPKVDVVAMYCPHTTLVGRILGFSCRYISTMDRIIHDSIMTSEVPDMRYMFVWHP